MREIKFRGKRKDTGEWETGSLVIIRSGCSDASYFIADKMSGYNTPVIPETVGQYTGLRDRSGREIYEGDIMQGKYNLVLIKWGRTAFLPYRNQNGSFSKVTNWASVEKGEIIGNIYDNPELLEVR